MVDFLNTLTKEYLAKGLGKEKHRRHAHPFHLSTMSFAALPIRSTLLKKPDGIQDQQGDHEPGR